MKDKNLNIEFFSTIPFLNDIKECRPRPLAQLMPEWWKSSNSAPLSIKECPAIIHMLKDSYVVPMWCDVEIIIENNNVGWRLPHPDFAFESHADEQFLDFAPNNVKENTAKILKAICPWNIKTPKGYSVYQTSNFYGFNDNFSIFPGIINTDYHHEINQQMMLHGKNKTFSIKRGEPFAIYTPFKREKFDIVTRDATKEDIDSFARNSLNIFTKFKGGYKKALKELDSK
jgi:hypothetical protein